ncbi:phage tail sheath family protein [Methylobacter sp.]|uniref:phage tail sheath family protein n=1 Tax=Methylobacter sp. TaxID=2051955 RepID=UPI002FDF0A1B
MVTYSTPGVYVEEISTLAPSVASVATAIPAFIGYTEKGPLLEPTRIDTMLDYVSLFGSAKPSAFTVNDDASIKIDEPNNFLMYYGLSLYFQNGGGSCYIVSVGDYKATPAKDDFTKALTALEKEDEPTLIVLLDATTLTTVSDYYDLCKDALSLCEKLGDRFLIVDIPDGNTDSFRTAIGSNNLCYAAAYHPYLKTSLNYLYQDDGVTIGQGTSKQDDTKSFTTLIGGDNGMTVSYTGTAVAPKVTIAVTTTITDKSGSGFDTSKDGILAISTSKSVPPTAADLIATWSTWKSSNPNAVLGFDIVKSGDGSASVGVKIDQALSPVTTASSAGSQNTTTLATLKGTDTAQYNKTKSNLVNQRVTLPPSAAIAGVYASVDRDRGVWKTPANVSLNGVIGPLTKISDTEQDRLNIDSTAGKSINAIRDFTGKGTLVWGGRTLAGNDNEWRYISVRRLFITIEESTRKASAFAVFEPNDATTWLKVKAMIESYLYGLWQQGALAGSKPESAYFVSVGLGKTMTAQDILEGRLIVTIGVAAVRPAEFIILRFSHKMQEA